MAPACVARCATVAKTLATGLVIRTRTDVQNLCSCVESRRTGALCPHSLALGLAWVHRKENARTAAGDGNVGSVAEPARGRPSGSAAAKPLKPEGPLSFQFPQTFFEGLRRDRLTVAVRVGGTAPFGEAAAGDDLAFIEWLRAQRLDRIPSQLVLADAGQIDSLLLSLGGHPRVRAGTAPLSISASPVRLPLEGEPVDPHRVKLRVERAGEFEKAAWMVRPGRALAWGLTSNPLNLFAVRVSPMVYPFVAELASGRADWIEQPLSWLARHADELTETFEIAEDARWAQFRRAVGVPRFRLLLDGRLERMSAVLWCRYADLDEFRLPGDPASPDAFPVVDPSDPTAFWDRNREAEAAALARLERAGFTQASGDTTLSLNNEAAFLQFFASELPRLEKLWTIEFSQRAANAVRPIERVQPRWTPVSSGSGWFEFDLAFHGTAGTRLSQADARRWLQTGRTHRRLGNGRIAVLGAEEMADFEEVLRDLHPQQEHGHFRISTAQREYLANSIAAASEADIRSGRIFHTLRSLERVFYANINGRGPAGCSGSPRSNSAGFSQTKWDSGKTVQALAVVSTLTADSSERRQPSLVVAPTSLLGNWAAEAARFAPELRVLVIRSGERSEELSQLADHDIVITSYPLLVRDLAHHTAVTWRAIFLDEAGFIRNPDTQAARAVRKLDSPARFALTGTPIENSVRDLWSIAQFAVPGYLGPRDEFRERYELPLAAGDPAATARLRRRMSPFWLRRLKQDVARDLPAKIETVVACELTPLQREIYAAIQREGVRKIDEARRSQTSAQARLTMLTALLRLRQVCGDPRLLGESFPNDPPETLSGKWAALVELLEEIRDGGHSALIFSQFATQLRLLHDAVRSVDLDFCHLDGSTPDRDAQIEAFQSNPAKRIFLISLKAGGLRAQPHQGRHCHPFRPVVESSRRSPGHRPRPPHRPSPPGHRLQTHRHRHRRRKNPRPPAPQTLAHARHPRRPNTHDGCPR